MLVTQLCLTSCDPMDGNPPGSSVHGILQVRILEWVAIPFSRHLPSGVAWSEKEKKKYYTKSLLLKWRFSSWHLTGQSSSGVENNRKKDMAGKPYNTHPPFPCRID